MFLAPNFFGGTAPRVFRVGLKNSATFRPCGKVSGRSVEGARRTSGETKKKIHHGQNISPSGTVVPGGLKIPKIRGSTIVLEPWRYVVTFAEEGAPETPPGYPPQAPLPSVTSVPRSMPCFRCMRSLDHLQFSPNFYHFYICLSTLKMYRVVLTVDCRNSVCRNSVCLPYFIFH